MISMIHSPIINGALGLILGMKIELYFMNIDVVIFIYTEMSTIDSSFSNLLKLIGQLTFAETSTIEFLK